MHYPRHRRVDVHDHGHSHGHTVDRATEKKQSALAYGFLHVTLLAATLYFDNPVSLSVFGQGSIWFALSFFALMFLGIGFYIDVSTADPGYVSEPEQGATIPTRNGPEGYSRVPVQETVVDVELRNTAAVTPADSAVAFSPPSESAMPPADMSMLNPLENQIGCNPMVTAAAMYNVPGITVPHRTVYQAIREREDFCWSCNFIRPPRSKHCEKCEHCVVKFDHHCPFVANCIGGKNHYKFWRFLFVESIMLSYCLWMAFCSFKTVPDTDLLAWIGRTAFFGYTGIVLLLVGSLLFFHSYLASVNKTTLEMVREQRRMHRRNPRATDLENARQARSEEADVEYDEGWFRNVWQFCRGSVKAEWSNPVPTSSVTRATS